MSERLIFHGFKNLAARSIDLYAREENTNRFVERAEFTLSDNTSQGRLAEPFWRMREEEAQSFIDALWEAGVRPSNGEGSTGKLAATENHLNDMRKIVFHQLGVDNV
jgi:hypothetical protein